MAVDRHVNLVLCNTEEYRKYKVKGKPEGKELKRMLGFIVVRGVGVLYVQPEELGKEELVETDKPKKIKAAPKAPASPKAAAPLVLPGLLQGMSGLRPPGLPGLPGLPPGLPPGLLNTLAARPGGPGLPGMLPGGMLPGAPGGLPALPGMGFPGMPGMPGGFPGMPGLHMP